MQLKNVWTRYTHCMSITRRAGFGFRIASTHSVYFEPICFALANTVSTLTLYLKVHWNIKRFEFWITVTKGERSNVCNTSGMLRWGRSVQVGKFQPTYMIWPFISEVSFIRSNFNVELKSIRLDNSGYIFCRTKGENCF